jgi:hypothetical protein
MVSFLTRAKHSGKELGAHVFEAIRSVLQGLLVFKIYGAFDLKQLVGHLANADIRLL